MFNGKDSTTVHSDVDSNCESSSSHKSSHFDVSKSTQKHDQEVQSQANRGMIEGGLVVDSKQDLGLLKEGSASSFEVEDSIRGGIESETEDRPDSIHRTNQKRMEQVISNIINMGNTKFEDYLKNLDEDTQSRFIMAKKGIMELSRLTNGEVSEVKNLPQRAGTFDQQLYQSSERPALIEKISSTGSMEADHLVDMILHETEDVFDSKYLMKLHEEYKIQIEKVVNDRMNAGESLLEIARSMGCDGSVDTKETEGYRPLIRDLKESNEKYVQRMQDLARSVNKKYKKRSISDIVKAIIDKDGNYLNSSEQNLDVLAVNTALSLKNVYKFSDDRLLHEADRIKNLYLNCNSQEHAAEYIYQFYKEQPSKFGRRRFKQNIVLILGKFEERLNRLKEKYPNAKAGFKRGKEMALLKKLTDLKNVYQEQFSNNLIKMIKELHSYDKISSEMEMVKRKYWETIVDISNKECKNNLKARYKQAEVAYETFKDRSSHKQRVQTQFSIKDIRDDMIKEIREKNATLERTLKDHISKNGAGPMRSWLNDVSSDGGFAITVVELGLSLAKVAL